jgi:hypothetical protein
MSDANVLLQSIEIKGEATVLHAPGAVTLDAYPLLVYAPIHHGPAVCTEDNQTPVEEIVKAFAVNPNAVDVAALYHTTTHHVFQAIQYAQAVGYASIKG